MNKRQTEKQNKRIAQAEASIRKIEGLLHKNELIRKCNAGVNANGQIVDIREESGAVPVPPHKLADHVLPNVKGDSQSPGEKQ